MKTLKQIKDDYAIQQGFANWYELLTYCKEKYLNHYITEVMKIYAMECLKLASEELNKTSYNSKEPIMKIITNEKNIIK